MALALYDESVGYYRRNQTRIGRESGTDFYTATSVGPLFGELVAHACVSLAGAETCARSTFVELGAEPSGGILAGTAHPFAAARTIRLGEPMDMSGPLIVFSNELFDAQPCRRLVRRAGEWRELGVSEVNGRLRESELPLAEPAGFLPATAPEGYHLDAPCAATTLLQTLASQPWSGLFIAFDYGKSWTELSLDTPQGTARAYQRHQQSHDLLARPGEQDLTCHVCWDWLSDGLVQEGFGDVTLQSQESFFVHHGASLLAATAEREATRLSQRKLALMQLIHPSHLGQKFQVLHGRREHAKEI
ncbi:MAG: SAM-dependent methyltransferase [Cephaloticoccus sp.]